MNTMNKWQKQYETVDKSKGGYSDVRLWPCYMAYSALILFLAPFISIGLALIIVTSVAMIIAIKLEERRNRNPESVVARIKAVDDLYKAIEERDELARIESKKLTIEVKRRESSVDVLETGSPKATVALTT